MRDEVSAFYEMHPYPPAVDDLVAYRRFWDDKRRRADSHLFWPHEPYRDDRSILVAGCGTTQAAHYAARWPCAKVTAIDVSATSLASSRELKHAHALDNLELYQLPIERAPELGRRFDAVVCTGVLHHLLDPDAGLRALHDVLEQNGAMHLMVYAPYGRAGVYMLQDYCRRIGLSAGDDDIHDLAAALRALPPDHPLVPLLRNSPDFASTQGLADALLHPQDRAYSVPQFLDFLARADLFFGRWIRQAPYLPQCGAVASTPHAAKLAALPAGEQYAAIELFRGTMVRHAAVAYRSDRETKRGVEFESDAWLDYVPIRAPEAVTVRERLPDGATAVLINRSHTFTDLYLPIDAVEDDWLSHIDGARTIAQICGANSDRGRARAFFEQLWQWDQVVYDACGKPPP
ncbi:MAG TPA: class I SAM-dependent methyltransferase [Verrucomicrobiae bacterium]|nr:class I SAM-dependent methyltransferase [Verrucomicrobiae bacterium]